MQSEVSEYSYARYQRAVKWLADRDGRGGSGSAVVKGYDTECKNAEEVLLLWTACQVLINGGWRVCTTVKGACPLFRLSLI